MNQDTPLISLDNVCLSASEYVGVHGAGSQSLFSRFYRRNTLKSKEILSAITFDLRYGDRVALIGSNGAGKSTLLKLLARIKRPTSGDCKYSTEKLALLGNHQLGFSESATVRENIISNGLSKGISYERLKKETVSILEFAELATAIDRPVQSLSSGQKMRIALGVTLLADADVFLFDEWIGALDKYFFEKFSTALKKKLVQSSGLVIASHNINMLRQVCNKAIWIEDVRVCQIVDLESVLAKMDEAIQDHHVGEQ